MEDEEILDLYFARDESAIARTAERHGPGLRRLARQMLNSPPDAEECENDTYLAAWNAIPPERPFRFFAWLAKVIRRLCLDRIRWQSAAKRSATVVELTAELEQCIPAPDAIREEDITRALRTFVGRLDREPRYVFVRRYWYGDSIADLASALRCTEGRIKSMLLRQRKKLKRYLEEEEIFL